MTARDRLRFAPRRGALARAWLFALVLGQLFTNRPILALGSSELSLQWHHLAGAAGFAALLARGKLRLPRDCFAALWIYALLLTALLIPRYGLGGRAVNALYAFCVYLTAYGLRDRFGAEDLARVMRAAGLIYAALVALNTLRCLPSVLDCLRGRRPHPAVHTWIGGGVNIEASYLALFSAFFLKGRGWWYWAFSLSISAGYGSRTGLLLDLLALGMALAGRLGRPTPRKLASALLLGAAGAGFLWAVCRAGLLDQVLARLSRIGGEAGSIARMRLWNTVPRILAENPLGCGLGNAIGLARRYAGIDFPEGNLHNVYLQQLVELGLPGALMWAGALLGAIVSAGRLRFRDPAHNAVLLFCAGFLVQFVGTEPLFFVLMALCAGRGGSKRWRRSCSSATPTCS